ncbi:unnamed protein product [Polarella glacialis]|uniref:P-type ATPase N-terminal domain-containing protein n=2 Tax=Polarella glacialis TaxID=89957 RepID=A0A813G486_POLGL|nr:unnamed protein product [Polarella glacialis]
MPRSQVAAVSTKKSSRCAETRRINLSPRRGGREAFPSNHVSTTKYRLWNIVPMNLFEQFHRAANVWFLVVSTFQMLPLKLSPTSEYATLLPLCCVLFVTFCKDAYEDYRRWKDDCRVNSQMCELIDPGSGGSWDPVKKIRWSDVAVGDFIRLNRDDPVPADVLMVCSSQAEGVVFVDSAQLDGETSLKPKTAPNAIMHMIQNLNSHDIEGHVEVELPNEVVQSFAGTLYLKGHPRGSPLELQNIVLRGSTIRNTAWALGLVVYTGEDTKMVRNSNRHMSPKRSQVEALGCHNVTAELSSNAAASAAIRAISFTGESSIGAVQSRWVWPEIDDIKDNPYLSFLTFMIGYNNLIPISLYMTTDLVRAAQAFLMERGLVSL